jgi:ATP-dependent exoDNAse (exonuclease V) alpha subunit
MVNDPNSPKAANQFRWTAAQCFLERFESARIASARSWISAARTSSAPAKPGERYALANPSAQWRTGRLRLADTRDQAAENAVQAWGQITSEHDDIRSVALIADASNQEIDRLNARAQHLRAERGELGHQEITLPNVHYGLRDGDLIAFTGQHHLRGQPRIENGTRGHVTHVHERGVTITLDGSGRRVQLASEHLDAVRLAYAQHVYRQQGATVERSIVVTGGWQTSKETAYVEATRARHGTDWFIARDQLGDDGQDADRIKRLAQNMSHSRRQTPSLDYREATDLG